MKFKNYKKYVPIGTDIPIEKFKFVATYKIRTPVEGFEITDHKTEIQKVIESHNNNHKHTYIEVLDLLGNTIVFGLESTRKFELSGRGDTVSRYIGRYIITQLKKLYNWEKYSREEHKLFMSVQVLEYNEDE